MRTLDRNKSIIWTVEPIGRTPLLDYEGYDTGESIVTFGLPNKVSISMYPSSGAIVEQIFGKDVSLDMIAVSNELVFTENTLLFLNEPVENYDTTYDYRVSAIKKSINTNNYGLRQRT